MKELEVYQELKSNNHPAKMLAVAEHWLRKELDESRAKGKFEKAQQAGMEIDPTARQGGYASGRNINTETTVKRQGRLSDMMGNAGVLAKNQKSSD
jgi:hypothetical protein